MNIQENADHIAAPLENLTLPADVPIQKLYYQNGYWHYASHCCTLDAHTSMILSTDPNLPLGCNGGGVGSDGEELDPPFTPLGGLLPHPKDLIVGAAPTREHGNLFEFRSGDGGPSRSKGPIQFILSRKARETTRRIFRDVLWQRRNEHGELVRKTFEWWRHSKVVSGMTANKIPFSFTYLFDSAMELEDPENPREQKLVVKARRAHTLPIVWLLTDENQRFIVTTVQR